MDVPMRAAETSVRCSVAGCSACHAARTANASLITSKLPCGPRVGRDMYRVVVSALLFVLASAPAASAQVAFVAESRPRLGGHALRRGARLRVHVARPRARGR